MWSLKKPQDRKIMDEKIATSTKSTQEVETVVESPLLSFLGRSDESIRQSRASRAVSTIQGQLVNKWNSLMNEFTQLELRYETAIDLSPKNSMDLGIEVGDVNRLVSNLSSIVESKHKMFHFQLKPLHDLMAQCFTSKEMDTLYKLPTL